MKRFGRRAAMAGLVFLIGCRGIAPVYVSGERFTLDPYDYRGKTVVLKVFAGQSWVYGTHLRVYDNSVPIRFDNADEYAWVVTRAYLVLFTCGQGSLWFGNRIVRVIPFPPSSRARPSGR